ncbi:MAG: hypothetical protein JW722_07490 [Demequinaceae bacterium]|nr:hypothetical protein [Demequinaceae bacterium]
MEGMAAMLIPGFFLFPIALLVSAGHLVWSLHPGRREWVLHRYKAERGSPAPTTEERQRIGEVARVLAIITTVSPGFLILVPPATMISVLGVLAYRKARNLQAGASRLVPRPRPVSVVALAWIGAIFGCPYPVALLVAYWPPNEWLVLFCLVWMAGLLGFVAGARQFIWIRALDLETQTEPLTLEDLHAYPNR